MHKIKNIVLLLFAGVFVFFSTSAGAENAPSVDLLWQTDTAVPPSYEGKALPSANAAVSVVALPHFSAQGRRIAPSNLVFEWSLDGVDLASVSGKGKESIVFRASELANARHTVAVAVSTASRSQETSGRVVIAVERPKIVFYELKALFGPERVRAISEQRLAENQEFDIYAEPFFFSEPVQNLFFSWKVNDKKVGEALGDPVLSFRPPSGTAGLFNITLTAYNTKDAIQRANARLDLRIP